MKHYKAVIEVTKTYWALVESDHQGEAEDRIICGDVNSFEEKGERIKVCSVTKVDDHEG